MLPTPVYYWADLCIGFGVPVGLYLWRAPAARPWRRLFWLGAGLGLLLELPVFFSAMLAEQPLLTFLTPPPLPLPVFLISHTLWDGSLFLAGVLLLRLVFGRGVLRRRSPGALALLLLWGQLSAFAVEISSVSSGAWSYVIPHRYNQVLFWIEAHPITLVPQLAWFVLPLLFWWLAGSDRFRGRERAPGWRSRRSP